MAIKFHEGFDKSSTDPLKYKQAGLLLDGTKPTCLSILSELQMPLAGSRLTGVCTGS